MSDIDEIQRRMMDAADRAANVAATDLMGRGQRLAPVEEGTLRGSGRVERIERADGVEYEVSFNTPYAARQHEELDWHHPLGGQAKYLQQPFLEQVARYERIIAEAVRQALEQP